MHLERKPSVPDIADRHRRLIAFALIAYGCLQLASVAARVADPSLATLLDGVEIACIVATLGFTAPVVWWKVRNRGQGDWHLYKGGDGVVAESISTAHTASWTVVFVLLVLVEASADRFEWMSAGLLIESVLATLVLSFAGTFLYLDRDPVGADPEPADA